MLSSMLLLPDDFQPRNRATHHNSCVHRSLDSPDVKVRVCVLVSDSNGKILTAVLHCTHGPLHADMSTC